MAEKKYKITEQRVTQIIKEEWSKKMKEIQLKKKLSLVNEELTRLQEDDLEEVTAGGETSTTSPDGLSKDAKKWAPQFEKKGSHLLEDEEITDEMPVGDEITDEMPGNDMETDIAADMEGPADNDALEDLDLDQLMGMVADKIQATIETEVGAAVGGEAPGEEISGDDMPGEEIPGDDIEVTDVVNTPEGGDETDIEITQEQEGDPIVNKQEPKNAVPFDNGKEGVEGNPEKSTNAGTLQEEDETEPAETDKLDEGAKKDDTKLVIKEGTELYIEMQRMRQLTGFSKKKLVN